MRPEIKPKLKQIKLIEISDLTAIAITSVRYATRQCSFRFHAHTKLEPMMLFTNYRLPRSVAKITQGYVGVNVEPYSERTYANNSTLLPSIVKYEDRESQVIAIAEIIEASNDKSIGIFLPDNSMVLEFCKQLSLS